MYGYAKDFNRKHHILIISEDVGLFPGGVSCVFHPRGVKMKINSESMKKILIVLAEQYFNDNGWKYFSVREDFEKVQKFAEDVNRQYLAYQNISRDWYVQNSGSQNRFCCRSWDELKTVVNILQINGKFFDFYVDTGEFRCFCVVLTDEGKKNMPENQIEAILDAEKMSVRTVAFIAAVSGDAEASVLQIKKSGDE